MQSEEFRAWLEGRGNSTNSINSKVAAVRRPDLLFVVKTCPHKPVRFYRSHMIEFPKWDSRVFVARPEFWSHPAVQRKPLESKSQLAH